MAIEEITDREIAELVAVRKEIQSGSSVPTDKGSHLQKNFEAISEDGHRFSIYTRQSKKIANHFSCGLLWHLPSGEKLTLRRYNGPSHLHVNRLESTDTSNRCHVHMATERYIQALRKPEGYAEPTDRYSILSEAVGCLIADCNITGLLYEEPQLRLLDDEH